MASRTNKPNIMKTPYKFDFNGDNRFRQVLNTIPLWCTFPLLFANIRFHYLCEKIEIISQQLNYRPFFVDLIEVKAEQPGRVPFRIDGRKLFLYFMLKGKVTFTTADDKPIAIIRTNTFLISIYDSGSFAFHINSGRHIALLICILPQWIEKMTDHFPNLKRIVYMFNHNNHPYQTVFQNRIDRKIGKWLIKIYSFSQQNIGAIDGNLRKYVSYSKSFPTSCNFLLFSSRA